jgi:hypothetical protein
MKMHEHRQTNSDVRVFVKIYGGLNMNSSCQFYQFNDGLRFHLGHNS